MIHIQEEKSNMWNTRKRRENRAEAMLEEEMIKNFKKKMMKDVILQSQEILWPIIVNKPHYNIIANYYKQKTE